MKNSSLGIRICAAIALTAGLVSISQAQNREKFVISARAGAVKGTATPRVRKLVGLQSCSTGVVCDMDTPAIWFRCMNGAL